MVTDPVTAELTALVVSDLAPGGVLRAAINLGNPVLAQGPAAAPGGVTVDIARELGPLWTRGAVIFPPGILAAATCHTSPASTAARGPLNR